MKYFSIYILLFIVFFSSCKKDKELSPQEICDQSTAKVQAAYNSFLADETEANCLQMKAELTDGLANCLSLENDKINELAVSIKQYDCDKVLCDKLLLSVNDLIQLSKQDPSPENCNNARNTVVFILDNCINLGAGITEFLTDILDELNCNIDLVACNKANNKYLAAQEAYLENANSTNCDNLKNTARAAMEACGESISDEDQVFFDLVSTLDCDPEAPCNVAINDLTDAIKTYNADKSIANCNKLRQSLNQVFDVCNNTIKALLLPIKEQLDSTPCS